MIRTKRTQAIGLAGLLLALLAVALPFAGGAPTAYEEWRWTATGSMNEARYLHTATLLLDGRVLVAGGASSDEITASAEIYDPATGAWSRVGALGEPRYDHTATRLADGRVLVAGGRTTGDVILDSAELFDPATGEWSTVGRMGSARAGHTATLLSDGDVLVSGGYAEHETKSYSERYHPATGAWTWAGAMKKVRALHGATALADGRVLLVGGYQPGNVAELFDPATDRWRYTGGRATAFPGWTTATRLDDGQVMATSENTAARYDPAAEAWTGGYTGWRMFRHAAAPMGDGRALVCGGYDDTTLLPYEYRYSSTTYLFDPLTDEWSYGGSMTQVRVAHTATRLLDGRVLVAGGEGLGALDSAELFAPFLRPYAVYAPVVLGVE